MNARPITARRPDLVSTSSAFTRPGDSMTTPAARAWNSTFTPADTMRSSAAIL